jgi:hypothetical protein
MLIRGSCHCGNLAFALDWKSTPNEILARACTCSFCTKHGAVWTSCPTGSLRIGTEDPAFATSYAFGTKTADFHVCSRCGIVPIAISRIDGRLFAVVNVNTFVDVDPALLRHSTSTLDGEGVGDRLARRARNWIADVAFVERAEHAALALRASP